MKRASDLTPWFVIGGIILAWILARVLSGGSVKQTTQSFANTQPDQRGAFGTSAGLYAPSGVGTNPDWSVVTAGTGG